MDDTVFVWNISHLIVVVGEVGVHIVVEVLSDAVSPAESELHTDVLHVTTIYIRCTSTYGCEDWRLNQPVFCGLVVPVECHVQAAVEEASVETEVELL